MIRTLATLALFGAAALAAPARAEDLTPEALVEQKAPAIVSLKYVLKYEGGERPQDARGAVVDPTGLVVLANEYLGGQDVKATGIKVLFGADPKEWESVVVARDSTLGLAYVQVIGLEKAVPSIDLSKGAEPKLAQDLTLVWRDTRGFDFAPGISRHYVSGRVEKPRAMWMLGGDGVSVGMPLFDTAGKPVGISAYQAGSEGSDDDNGNRTVLLPLADAIKSLDAAKKRVPDAVAKAAEAKKASPEPGTEGAAPAATPPGMAEPQQPAPKEPAPKEPAPPKDAAEAGVGGAGR